MWVETEYPYHALRSPVRDEMWVENEHSIERQRAVRNIFRHSVPTGLSECLGLLFLYPHSVPKGTLTSSLLKIYKK